MARLGELLVAAGLLTTDQVERALRAQVMWGARLGTNLIELGFIDLDTLSTVLAQQHTLPAALARHFEKVDRELQRSLHADVAEMYTCLPLVKIGGRDVVLASSSPLTKKAQARIADELAVEPEHIISAIAAELRMRYQLERVYNIQRPARFMRSPGKTIPPFPAFDVDEEDPQLDGDELLEVEVEPPDNDVGDVKSTQPFLATYTAPQGRSPSIPPATLEAKKPVPTVDELSVDVDMDDSASRTPAKPAPASAPAAVTTSTGSLPFTQPSLPVPGVEPVVIKPRTSDAKMGVATPPPRIAIVTPSSEDDIQTVPVSKLEEREVTLDSDAPARPSAPKLEPAKPGFVKPVPSMKPVAAKPAPSRPAPSRPDPATKFPSLAKFDAIEEAEQAKSEAAIPEVLTDALTRPAAVPSIGKPVAPLSIVAKDSARRDDETKPGLAVAKPDTAAIAKRVDAAMAKSDAAAVAKPDMSPVAKPDMSPVAKPDMSPVAKPDISPVAKPDISPKLDATPGTAPIVSKSGPPPDAAPRPLPSVPRSPGAIPSIVPKKHQTTPGVVVPRPPAPARSEPAIAKSAPAIAKSDAAKLDGTSAPAPAKVDAKGQKLDDKRDGGKREKHDSGWEIPDPDPASALFATSDAGAPDGAASDAIPQVRGVRAATEDSGAIAVPTHNLADLDALSAEVDDALSIPEVVDDDRSSGRERRRYVRTITDTPSESERQSQSLGRIAIRRLAIARATLDAEGNTLGEATRAIRRSTNRDRVADLCVDTLFRFAPSFAAASLMVVRGQVATTWKGFIRDGSTPPEIAVPLDQPGLIPKAVHRNTTVRAPSTDLGPIDQLLMVSLAQKSGDMVIVPISIAKQVMCVIALVTDADSPIATAESVAAGAGAAFARLMRDASR